MTEVGWYVHHHGMGHLSRFLAVRPHVEATVVAFSSLPAPAVLPPRTTWVTLPRDDDDEAGIPPSSADPTAGGALHWAPIGHTGHAARLAAIASRAPALDAVVVDVSVEVTLLARLLGRRVVLVTQPGDRTDEPHVLGRRLADAIVAPWPAEPAAETPLRHVGGISRFAARERTAARQPRAVLALGGGAHDAAWERMLDRAVRATPDWQWRIAGRGTWIDDPWQALCEADVVVSAGGQNAIADLAAADARSIVVPRPRPFDEQEHTAARLDRLGLAVVTDHDAPTGWPALLDRAQALRPDWRAWGVRGAAERAAAIIDDVAAGGRP